MNLYLPNEEQVTSLETYLQLVHQHREGVLVTGGDLNMVMDPNLDTSKGPSHLSYAKLRRVKKLLHDLQLIDSWRTVHVQDRDYNFFPGKYKTYTRINYIFISQNVVTSLLGASIGSFTLSDHAPTNCVVELGELDSREWHWKINETLLKEKEYENQELDSFFLTNDTGEIIPFCLWEAHKCYMRGTLISLGTHRKKMLKEQIESLLKRIRHWRQCIKNLRHNKQRRN